MKNKIALLVLIWLIKGFSLSLLAQSSVIYDIVIMGGRVIDPETKLDTIKNVGILNNRK